MQGVSDSDQDDPADRCRRALPADQVEPIERAEHAGRGCRGHCRQKRAIEHRQPQLLGPYADPSGNERQKGDADEHTANAAQRI